MSSNLIKCPDCQKDVSKLAQSCPGCGRPLRVSKPTNYQDDKPKIVITRQDSVWKRNAGCGDLILYSPLIMGLIYFIAVLKDCAGR